MWAKLPELVEARSEKGLTQEGLAKKAGISRESVQRIEKSGERTSPEFASYIAQALKKSLSKIFESDEEFKEWPAAGGRIRKVNFIPHFRQKLGGEFKTTRILQQLARNKGKVEVLGRTCRSWLAGPDPTDTSHIQDLIINAVKNQSKIILVVQKPTVRVPFFSDEDTMRLRGHLRESIASYLEVRDRLRKISKKSTLEDRIKLFFTDQQILQSMARIKRDRDQYGWLLVSVRTDFKPEERLIPLAKPSGVITGSRPFGWDPQIIFRTDAPQAVEYLARLELMVQGRKKPGVPVIDKPIEYERYRISLLNRVKEEVREYKHGSPLRSDTGANLAAQAVRHFLVPKSPPMCVHLLVTSRCPGGCPMCTQGNRQSFKPNANDVKELLRHISGLGARAVVISGGDPLYREEEDIFEILEFARKGANLPSGKPLALGIMTRGISLKNGDPSTLSPKDADQLTKLCRWIQISMDTFVPNSGSTVQCNQGDWDLKIAVASARLIWDKVKHNKSRVELCFTIHKGNIEEIDKIHENAQKIGIPNGMPIRLKFAHSKTANTNFLCSPQDLFRLRDTTLRQLAEDENLNVNAKYLSDMMSHPIGAVRDVANGHPVETALSQCKKRGDKCYVQELICTIDSDGKVYPCCYLFDDTAEYRIANPIGSLWDEEGHTVLLFEHHPDKLKEIWRKRKASPDLPVNELACARCTRHLHQNELLNKIQRILDEGSPLEIAEHLENALNQRKVDDERYKWCNQVGTCFWL